LQARALAAIQRQIIFFPKIEGNPMAIERTFSMIKPDATKRNITGAITRKLEDAGLRVVASKRVWMSLRQAEGFYAVHKERPFFGELTEFMSSAPTIVQVLEGENAIAKNREVMGATNPADADEGTIRKEFALSLGENSVHGSDAPQTASEEISYWFSDIEIVG
jgi:nucleoside-diphosphate kinase